MSLILPIMINTTTIGALTIRRIDCLKGGGEHAYEWELQMNDTPDLRGTRRGQTQAGYIAHRYDDGAVQLIKKVMEQIS